MKRIEETIKGCDSNFQIIKVIYETTLHQTICNMKCGRKTTQQQHE